MSTGVALLWDSYPVKGAYYHRDVDPRWQRLRSAMEETPETEHELFLEREPTNRYDRKAIRVLKDGDHIGFVPAASNHQLAMLMDHGKVRVTAKLNRKSDFVNHRLFMDVYVTFLVDTQAQAETALDKKRREIEAMLNEHDFEVV